MERIDPTSGPRYSATASTTPKEEVKDAPNGANLETGWIFPFQPFWIIGYFFPSLYQGIPSQWRVIQSLPHLVLLIGIWTNVGLLVRVIEDSYYWYQRRISYVVVMTSSGIFAAFCYWQLFKQLVQYRHDLQTRAAQVENLKVALATQFESSASELEELLARSTNTEAGLAERNLDSERRDFQRFLKNMSPKLSESLISLPVEDAFRRFLQIGLVVMAECSADPVGRPYTVIGEAELLSLSAAELSERLSQYLKANEIRFIKDNVEEGKKDILKIKGAWKTMVVMQRKAMKLAGLSRFAKKTCPDEEQGKEDDKAEALQMPAVEEREKIDAFWFRFQLGSGCGLEVDEEEHFPIRFRGLLFIFIILSPEHFSLLLSFFLSLLFITGNALLWDPSRVIIASLGVSSLCMAFVLYDFLDIDSVQRLEQQIAEMKATTHQVEKRRYDLQAFFARVHILMSLWQSRTLPRLEMLKQLGIMMEDEELSDRLLTEIVEKLSAFESTMLPLRFWQEESVLSHVQKYDSLQLLQPLSSLPGKDLLEQMPETTAKLRQLANEILDAREAPETG